MWRLLAAMAREVQAGTVSRACFEALLADLCVLLPCRTCRAHWRRRLDAVPVGSDAVAYVDAARRDVAERITGAGGRARANPPRGPLRSTDVRKLLRVVPRCLGKTGACQQAWARFVRTIHRLAQCKPGATCWAAAVRDACAKGGTPCQQARRACRALRPAHGHA